MTKTGKSPSFAQSNYGSMALVRPTKRLKTQYEHVAASCWPIKELFFFSSVFGTKSGDGFF